MRSRTFVLTTASSDIVKTKVKNTDYISKDDIIWMLMELVNYYITKSYVSDWWKFHWVDSIDFG